MDDARLYVCARCGEQVWICPRCDRGNQYCGQDCSKAARRASVRAAGARYQRTQRGRHCHAQRQRRYRERRREGGDREEVTHHGSAARAGDAPLARDVPATGTRRVSAPPSIRCHFCDRPVSAYVRLSWVRTRRERRRAMPVWRARGASDGNPG